MAGKATENEGRKKTGRDTGGKRKAINDMKGRDIERVRVKVKETLGREIGEKGDIGKGRGTRHWGKGEVER